MDDVILLSNLNDFIFCPASIYFHNLYGGRDKLSYQKTDQINGANAHKASDESRYSTRKSIITALEVYSEEYGIVGKIDVYDAQNGTLTERKKKIRQIYEGYVFQLYGQCHAMREMGYDVQQLFLYSMDDNKKYSIPLPECDASMQERFEKTIFDMRTFDMEHFIQKNPKKCQRCIYEPACDRAANRGGANDQSE